MEQRFQTFITRLRPHRIAVLVNSNDKEWQHTCKRIIEWLSQVWGGAHSLIVPTDGQTIDHQFWTLLSSFDPDSIVRYHKTFADVETYAPDVFAKNVTDLVRDWMKQDGVIGDEGLKKERAEESLREWGSDDFSISTELAMELLRRISPFHLENDLQIELIHAGGSPGYPFTKVVDIVLPAGAPDYIMEPWNNREPGSSMPPSLWLLAEAGIASKTYRDELESKGVKTASKPMNTDSEYDMIKWGINPSIAFGSNSPFEFTRLALRQVRSTASHQYTIPSALVIGETLKDFCLYYALSRLHGRAIWLPSWFMPPSDGSYPVRMINAVNALEKMVRGSNNRSYALLSTSVAIDALQDLRQTLQRYMTRNSFQVEDGTATAFIDRLVRHPLKFYITKNMERITTHLLVDDKLPGHFESPVPTAFSDIDLRAHRWLVEVTYSQHETPRHPVLGRYLASDPNLWSVRAANDGLTYSCPGSLVQGPDVELQMLRPTVTVPTAEQMFRIMFDGCGYECRISDKGAYESQTIAKFGGVAEIGTVLRHRKLTSLLNKFIDKTSNVDGVHDEGVYLRDKRRYLNLASVLKILGDATLAWTTIDEFIGKKIFYRGFVLRCSRCADVSWFSAGEVTDCFTCRRCGTNQQYVHASWRHPDEPAWFYKLDEMVYQMLAHDGDVTILTLNSLKNNSKRSFLYAPELALIPKGEIEPEMEIDLCCILEGKTFIGEAKSVDTLKEKNVSPAQAATRYREMAEKLGATGVVFSTSAQSWNAATMQAIDAVFGAYPHLKVLKLAQGDL